MSHIVGQCFRLPESGMDCSSSLAVTREDSTNMPFLCHHGGLLRNPRIWEDRDIGMVLYEGLKARYLCFAYTPASTVSLVPRIERTKLWR